jgi:integrase
MKIITTTIIQTVIMEEMPKRKQVPVTVPVELITTGSRWYLRYVLIVGGKKKVIQNEKGFTEIRKLPLHQQAAAAEQLRYDFEQTINGAELQKDLQKLMLFYIDPALRKGTRELYKNTVVMFFRWLNGRNIDTHTGTAYNEHISTLYQPNTQNTVLTNLSVLFKIAVKEGGFPFNPFAGIKHNRDDNGKGFKLLKTEELNELLAKMKLENPKLWLFCSIIRYCYIRPIEICRLEAKHIDLNSDRPSISTPKEISKNKKSSTVVVGKTLAEAFRCVPLPSEGCLFPKYKTMSNAFAEFRKAHGISAEIKMYSFKHTGNIEAITLHGIDIFAVQKQNRHQDLRTTQRYLKNMFDVVDNKYYQV